MIGKTLSWILMVLLSLIVASYAAALVLEPALRSPFVRALFAAHPLATAGHFAGSALALAIGGFQLSPWLRTRYIKAHRWLGRLYLLGVALGGLSGLFLAPYASGGTVARFGFGTLAVFWLGCTLSAYYWIRAGNVGAHRRWMIRSFALTFGAVTLRIYIPASQIAGIPFELAYPVISWLAWVPNLLVAELLVRLASGVAPNNSLKSNTLRVPA